MAEPAATRAPGGRWAAYRHLIAAQVRSQTQYRASFVADLLSSVGFGLLDLAAVMVMFLVTPALGGFRPGEVLVMAGIALTGFATADLVVGNVERLRVYVRTGLLDAVLIRPLGVLPQLLALDVAPRRLGRLLQALAVYGAALTLAEIEWTWWRVLVAIAAPVLGAVFFGAIFVAGATVAFWWIESGELANSVTYGGKDFANTPMTVYSGWFRALFGYGLGFGFVAYYPGLLLFGRPDPLGTPGFLPWLSPLVAPVAVGLAALAWRSGVRHYTSTGS